MLKPSTLFPSTRPFSTIYEGHGHVSNPGLAFAASANGGDRNIYPPTANAGRHTYSNSTHYYFPHPEEEAPPMNVKGDAESGWFGDEGDNAQDERHGIEMNSVKKSLQ